MMAASSVTHADDGNQMFRTDRLTIVKSAVKVPSAKQTHVERTDRVGFYKSDVKPVAAKREVIKRSDRVTVYKAL